MADNTRIYYFRHDENQAMVTFLDTLGIELTVFEDSEEMLATINEKKPAICFTDLAIPLPKDGFEYCEKLFTATGIDCPIYFVHLSDSGNVRDSAKNAGAVDILKKPVDEDDLLFLISNLIETPELHELKQKLAGANVVEKLKALDGFESYEPKKILKQYLSVVTPFMTDIRSLICEFTDPEARLQYYAKRFGAGEKTFIEIVNDRAKTTDRLNLHQCIRMYGIDNVRNLLFSEKLHNYFYKDDPFWDFEEGKLNVEPKKMLRFAIANEEEFGVGTRYSTVSYITGLAFDFARESQASNKKISDGMKQLIDKGFDIGTTLSKAAFSVAKSGRQALLLEKHIIPACFGDYLGRIVLCSFHEPYLRTIEKYPAAKVPKSFQVELEQQAFGVHSGLLAGVTFVFAPGLAESYKACVFGHTPPLLKEDFLEDYQLAEVVRLARLELAQQKAKKK